MLSGINMEPQMHIEEIVFREKARSKQQSVTEKVGVSQRDTMNNSTLHKGEGEALDSMRGEKVN